MADIKNILRKAANLHVLIVIWAVPSIVSGAGSESEGSSSEVEAGYADQIAQYTDASLESEQVGIVDDILAITKDVALTKEQKRELIVAQRAKVRAIASEEVSREASERVITNSLAEMSVDESAGQARSSYLQARLNLMRDRSAALSAMGEMTRDERAAAKENWNIENTSRITELQNLRAAMLTDDNAREQAKQADSDAQELDSIRAQFIAGHIALSNELAGASEDERVQALRNYKQTFYSENISRIRQLRASLESN